jgi:hypothetical protein
MGLPITSACARFGLGDTATYACDLAQGMAQRSHKVYIMFSQDICKFQGSHYNAALKIGLLGEDNRIIHYPIRSSLGKIPPDEHANQSLKAVAILVLEPNKESLEEC